MDTEIHEIDETEIGLEKSREDRIKEELSEDGINGKLVRSDTFPWYYFYPNSEPDVYFRIEKLSIKKLY